MQPSKPQIAIIAVILIVALILTLLFTGIIPGLRSKNKNIVTGELTIWGIDSASYFEPIVSSYQTRYPDVAITYKGISERNYESQLVNALASGRGPDIFMVKNTWLPKHIDKMAFLDASQYPLASLENDFPEIVSRDFYSDSKTYAIPLYVDTLVLFYNKDILNNEGIVKAPETWSALNQLIPRLVEKTESGRIVQAAIALGSSLSNIDNAPDILSAFMLQDLVPIVVFENGRVVSQLSHGGEDSLKRYVGYANPASANYSWNEEMRNASDAFASEDLAMIIDYSNAQRTLKDKNPFINLAMSQFPQYESSEKSVNYASYWGLSVANNSSNQSLAWNFIGSTLFDQDIMRSYSQISSRPPALLSLVAENSATPGKEFLAKQTLTARSWYILDQNLIDSSFSAMISSVLRAQADPRTAILKAQEEINQLLENASL